jgi:hypothetical protein
MGDIIDKDDKKKNRTEGEKKLDGGALCFLKYKGNVLIRDLLTKNQEDLVSE